MQWFCWLYSLTWVKEKYFFSNKRECTWYLFIYLFITRDPAISIKLGDKAAHRFFHIYIFPSLVTKISRVWRKNYKIQRPLQYVDWRKLIGPYFTLTYGQWQQEGHKLQGLFEPLLRVPRRLVQIYINAPHANPTP
jgi:hypothetical protein